MSEELMRAVLELAMPPRTLRPKQDQITVTIKENHPKYNSIKKLLRSLATREEFKGGLIAQHRAIPGAFDEFMEALRELGIDVDRIKEELKIPDAAPPDLRHMRSIAQHAGRILPILQGMAREREGR